VNISQLKQRSEKFDDDDDVDDDDNNNNNNNNYATDKQSPISCRNSAMTTAGVYCRIQTKTK
jgi:hypothetical protein